MVLTKIKVAAVLLAVVAGLGAGTALFIRPAAAGEGDDPRGGVPATAAPAALRDAPDGFAWGKPVGGLQAGVGLKPGAKAKVAHGETLALVVKVRNTASGPRTITYLSNLFDLRQPTVTDADRAWKLYPVTMPDRSNKAFVFERTLDPGEELELRTVRHFEDFRPQLVFAPPEGAVEAREPVVRVAPGRYKVRYAHFLNGPGELAADLATGDLEVEVVPAPLAPMERGPGAAPGGTVSLAGGPPQEGKAYRMTEPEAKAMIQLLETFGRQHVWIYGYGPGTVEIAAPQDVHPLIEALLASLRKR